jgi:hypothetical protein
MLLYSTANGCTIISVKRTRQQPISLQNLATLATDLSESVRHLSTSRYTICTATTIRDAASTAAVTQMLSNLQVNAIPVVISGHY